MPDLKKMLTLEALSAALPSWLKRSTKPEYNADEIDSTLTTNQFVTASDKDNWNAKGTYSKPSGGIPKSDLSSIVQTSLEKADSALQSETDPTVPLWAKQTNKPSYTQDEVADGSTYKRVTQTEKDAWSGKQNALTTTQMQAVNSGITAAGVGQISTNQANVLYALEKVGANLFKFDTWANNVQVTNGTATVSENSIKITALNNSDVYTLYTTSEFPQDAKIDVTPGEKLYMTWEYSSTDNIDGSVYIFGNGGTSSMANANATTKHLEYTVPASGITFITMRVGLGTNHSGKSGTWSNMQIIRQAAHDAGLTEFQPYGAPNYNLTRLEAEDRAELVELVDNGAKNEFNAFYINAPNARGLTFTDNHDGSITITGNNNGTGPSIAGIRAFTSSEMSAMAGYILSGIPTNTAGVSMFIQKDASPWNNVAEINANETDVIESANYACTAFLMVPTNTQNVNVTVRPMICSKPKYTISPKYIFNGYKQPVKHANITAIEAGGYVKLGKLVNVVIRCVVGSECPAYTSIFTGLPFPASGLSYGANFVACASNQSVPIIVCANGTIQNGEVLPAMTQLLISATYICL